MAGRTRGSAGLQSRAAAIAELLQLECGLLLEHFRKKESLSADLVLSDGHLVSVPPLSSQLQARDKVWRLYSALLQCRFLLERAIAREEAELEGGPKKGDYQKQRKTVRDRLSLLIAATAPLLQATGGTAVLTPNLDHLETNGPTLLFDLKMWIYRIYVELDHWSRAAVATLQGLSLVTEKEHVRPSRSRRSTRR